jgi:hypothetical protein
MKTWVCAAVLLLVLLGPSLAPIHAQQNQPI